MSTTGEMNMFMQFFIEAIQAMEQRLEGRRVKAASRARSARSAK